MSNRIGLCTNVGQCTKADRMERISVPAGSSFVCPECARELQELGAGKSGQAGKIAGCAAAGLLVAALLGGAYWMFFGKPGGGAPPPPPSGSEVVLRLSGSNTIGSGLAPALAEAYLESRGATDVRRVPGADPEELTVEGRLAGQSAPQAIAISAHGSGTAFTDLEKGACDIGMASRAIKDEEKAKLAGLGDMTSRANEHVLALDGLAVIVNQASSVTALDVAQVRRIFSGAIRDWSEVGGQPGAIGLYARDDKSGTFDTFKTLVLRGEKLAAGAKRYEDSRQLSADVAKDVRGIGFIGLPFIGATRALKISEGSSLPMRPTPLTVGTEDYLLSRRLFFYTPAAPASSWVAPFVEFALSDAGQAIVKAEGFVGQSLGDRPPSPGIVEAPQGQLPQEYLRLTANAERLPFNIRFRSGSDDLDNKAFRDIGRLAQLMNDGANSSRAILLFGFADATGADAYNLKLSEERARAVAGEILSEGLQAAAVQGFGEAAPVASNETEEGKERNRRVEVWLRR